MCCLFFCSLQVPKMKAMQVISLTLLSVLAASAQVFKFGKCPKPAVQANFDATRVSTKLFFCYIFISMNECYVQHTLVVWFLQQFQCVRVCVSSAVHW